MYGKFQFMQELEKNKGTQFDPSVTDAMIRLLKRNAFRDMEN